MGNMFDLLDRLKVTEIKPIVILCIEQSQYEILSFNRGQLYAGQDNTGSLQSPLYADERYAEHKNEMNPIPGLGVPDLFVTGEFYNSLKMTVNPSQYNFTIFSDGVEYAPKLDAKWEKSYGLDPDNKEYFATEILKPKIVGELKQQLGLV